MDDQIIDIPSVARCLALFDRYAMLDNIRAHSVLVARVAATLVDGLDRTGKCATPQPDRPLAVAAALLHDIAKTACITSGCHHALEGQRICAELGYRQIGEIVAEHVVLVHHPVDLYSQGIFTAKELVYYADKRVLHDTIATLADRLTYILTRYGDGSPEKEELIRRNFQHTVDLERHLFSFLDFSPEALADNLVALPVEPTAASDR